jgi:hypothetical protein
MRSAIALLLVLAGCGSGAGNNSGNGAARTAASGTGTVTIDDSDWQALVQVGVEACLERANTANTSGSEDAIRRACECAVPRLMEGKSVEQVQAMWREPGYPQSEADTGNRCLGAGT